MNMFIMMLVVVTNQGTFQFDLGIYKEKQCIERKVEWNNDFKNTKEIVFDCRRLK